MGHTVSCLQSDVEYRDPLMIATSHRKLIVIYAAEAGNSII